MGGNVGTISYIDEFIEDYIKTRGQLEHFMPNGALVLTKPPSDYIVYRRRYFSGYDAKMGVMKTAEAWEKIKEQIRTLLNGAPYALAQLDNREKQKGNLGLDKPFMDLISILTTRANVLTKLVDSPPPDSDEEIEALSAVSEQYRKLKDRLGQASQALAAYIKANTGDT